MAYSNEPNESKQSEKWLSLAMQLLSSLNQLLFFPNYTIAESDNEEE